MQNNRPVYPAEFYSSCPGYASRHRFDIKHTQRLPSQCDPNCCQHDENGKGLVSLWSVAHGVAGLTCWVVTQQVREANPWATLYCLLPHHYSDVIMSAMASQINDVSIILTRLCRRRSKKISKLRVTGLCEGIHRSPVNSPHKGSVTRKIFPFDDVIMTEIGMVCNM